MSRDDGEAGFRHPIRSFRSCPIEPERREPDPARRKTVTDANTDVTDGLNPE